LRASFTLLWMSARATLAKATMHSTPVASEKRATLHRIAIRIGEALWRFQYTALAKEAESCEL